MPFFHLYPNPLSSDIIDYCTKYYAKDRLVKQGITFTLIAFFQIAPVPDRESCPYPFKRAFFQLLLLIVIECWETSKTEEACYVMAELSFALYLWDPPVWKWYPQVRRPKSGREYELEGFYKLLSQKMIMTSYLTLWLWEPFVKFESRTLVSTKPRLSTIDAKLTSDKIDIIII